MAAVTTITLAWSALVHWKKSLFYRGIRTTFNVLTILKRMKWFHIPFNDEKFIDVSFGQCPKGKLFRTIWHLNYYTFYYFVCQSFLISRDILFHIPFDRYLFREKIFLPSQLKKLTTDTMCVFKKGSLHVSLKLFQHRTTYIVWHSGLIAYIILPTQHVCTIYIYSI